MVLLVLAPVVVSGGAAYSHSPWANTARGLDTKGRAGKRRRVDGRHPDPSLVDFEQVGDEGVEVDVRIRKVVEG